MSLHNLQIRVAPDSTQHRKVGVVLHHLLQLLFMTAVTGLVEDDTRKLDITVKLLIALQQRCDTACDAIGIDDQHHRQPQQFGHRPIAVTTIQRKTIIESLVPLYQHQITLPSLLMVEIEDLLLFHGIEVERVTRQARRHRQPHRIDVVRSFLEWRDRKPPCSICRTEAQCYGSLTGGFVCRREIERLHNSTTRPASNSI